MRSRLPILVGVTLALSCGSDGPAWTPAPVPYCAVDEAYIDAIHDYLTPDQRIGQHLMVGVEADGKGDPSLATLAKPTGGTDTIGSMPIGATGDPQVAFEEFDIMGREVRELGMNMDLGPVVDTLYSTRNGNLNARSFGPDQDMNAELGIAAVNGLQHNLVIAVAKHFPGDGLTDGNTHVSNVIVEGDREFLESTILKPFGAVVSHPNWHASPDGMDCVPDGKDS